MQVKMKKNLLKVYNYNTKIHYRHKCVNKRIFLFIDTSKNDCFTRVLEVIKYWWVAAYIEQDALLGEIS